MRDYARVSCFALIFIGTLGLLINEFITEWGSVATLIFAAFNLLGLTILIITARKRAS